MVDPKKAGAAGQAAALPDVRADVGAAARKAESLAYSLHYGVWPLLEIVTGYVDARRVLEDFANAARNDDALSERLSRASHQWLNPIAADDGAPMVWSALQAINDLVRSTVEVADGLSQDVLGIEQSMDRQGNGR